MAKTKIGKIMFLYKNAYNSSADYEQLDVVKDNGRVYACLKDCKGIPTSNAEYWQLISDIGENPIVGQDYYTEAEKAEYVVEVEGYGHVVLSAYTIEKFAELSAKETTLEADLETESNKATGIVENAISAFTTNASTKTSAFDENVSSKKSAFNSNATTKTSDYNQNATTKSSSFDNGASAKVADFNSNTSAKVADFNSNASAKTEQFNVNATSKVAEFDGLEDELLEEADDLFNAIPKKTVEGEEIVVEDGMDCRTLGLNVYGNTVQESTTGKNLLIGTYIKKEVKGNAPITISVSPNKTYTLTISQTLKAEGTGTNPKRAQHWKISYDSDGNVLNSNSVCTMDFTSIDETIVKTSTFTTPSNCTSLKIDLGAYISNPPTLLTNYYQLEQGSTATPYEPYTGGIPSPNPEFPQEIESVGDLVTDETDENYGKYKIPVNVASENLCPYDNVNFNKSYVGWCTFDGVTQAYSETNLSKSNCKINLKKGNYYMHHDSLVNCSSIQIVNLSGNVIANYSTSNFFTISEDTIIIPRINTLVANTDTKVINFMLTKSDEPKPYQPYFNQTTNIYLSAPLRKIGDYADYVDFNEGKVVRNIGEKTFNTLTQTTGNPTLKDNYAVYRIYGIFEVNKKCKATSVSQLSCFCNNFKHSQDVWLGRAEGIACYQRNVILDIRNEYGDTKEKFTEWLSQNPITIDYILETPTEETIEILDNTRTSKDTRIFSLLTSTKGKIKLTYAYNFKKRILELQAMLFENESEE